MGLDEDSVKIDTPTTPVSSKAGLANRTGTKGTGVRVDARCIGTVTSAR